MTAPLSLLIAILAFAFAPQALAAGNTATSSAPQGLLTLDPQNPHYFLWRGKPTVLVGSGEHYGAVLNRPFDYTKYLDTLQRAGLNHTRLFTGLYVEDNAARATGPQTGNTLDPAPGDLLCPFARSTVPGYAKGGNKFDLHRWDEAYFTRLKDFVGQAGKRGVVVEVNLFCPYYEEKQWKLSPLNPANNVNGLGPARRADAFTIDRSGGLLPIEEALVRRIVAELRDCDNIYYEICNEPYCGGIPLAWQERIAAAIVAAEKDRPGRHLISQNIANQKATVEKPLSAVSIYNFHYAFPPDAVAMNWRLDRPIGANETGFRGTADASYRREAWEFMLAGGGLFSHLDYSFTVGHEDGSFGLPPGQWGGGSPALREQLRRLKEFLEGFDFVHMRPDTKAAQITAGQGSRAAEFSVRALVERGEQYAIYVYGAGKLFSLDVELPPGDYTAQWLHPLDGRTEPAGSFSHTGGVYRFDATAYQDDMALAIRRLTLPLSADTKAKRKKVLLLGIDGCRPDAIPAAIEAYNLHALIREGAFSARCDVLGDRPTRAFTITGPGWSSALTGVWSDKHGVMDNDFKGNHLVQYPSLFHRFKQARPDAQAAAFVSWRPFVDYIIRPADGGELVADGDKIGYEAADRAVTAAAVRCLAEKDPDLVFAYFGLMDIAGHGYGFHPRSPKYTKSLEVIDGQIGRILAAVRGRPTFSQEDWLIISCADHGGRGREHGFGRDVPEIRNGFLLLHGDAVDRGSLPAKTDNVNVAAIALAHLGIRAEPQWQLDGRPVGLKAGK